MATACTHCLNEIGDVMSRRWDYSVEDGDIISFDCPICHKPLRAKVTVDHSYRIVESERGRREREKYRRRMKGDWS